MATMRTDMGVLGASHSQPPVMTKPLSFTERLLSAWRRSAEPKARALMHVESLGLGPRRALHLVECDGERFLIAAGDGLSAPVALTQSFRMRDRATGQGLSV